MKRILACVVALLLTPLVALSQPLQPTPIAAVWHPQSKLSSPISVTTSSAATALPTTGLTAWLCNTGANDAYLVFGTSSGVVATVAMGTWLKSLTCGTYVLFPRDGTRYTHVAALTSSSTTSIYVEAGTGNPPTGLGSGGGGGGAVTIADGADATQGAIADAAATAGSTGTVSAKLRLMTTQLATVGTNTTGLATSANQGTQQTNQTVVQGPVPSGAATATKFNLSGCEYRATKPTLADTNQGPCQVGTRGSLATTLYVADSTIAIAGVLQTYNNIGAGVLATGVIAQVDDVSPTVPSEGNFGNLRLSPNRALVMKPYSTTAGGDWTYAAAASGISNTTTAVTIKAAGSGTDRNCVTSIDLTSGALGAGTEFAIRDGAGGTVLWRIAISTAGLVAGFAKTFPTPICGTAATLLEVVTLTASVTGAVYVNAQGYAAP